MLVNVVGDSRRWAWINADNPQLLQAIRTESWFGLWRPLCLMGGTFLPLLLMVMLAGAFSTAQDKSGLGRFIWTEAISATIILISLTAYFVLRRRYRRAVQVFRQAQQEGEVLDTASNTFRIMESLFYMVYARPIDRLIRLDADGTVYKFIKPYMVNAREIEQQLTAAKDDTERLQLCRELINALNPLMPILLALDVMSRKHADMTRAQILSTLQQALHQTQAESRDKQ